MSEVREAVKTLRRVYDLHAAHVYTPISLAAARPCPHRAAACDPHPVTALGTGKRRKSGTLIRVRSSGDTAPVRKLLFDVRDLDALIEQHRETAA